MGDFIVNKPVTHAHANSDEENEEPLILSDNSGDSPQEDPIPKVVEEPLPELIITSTHRKDGKLYPKLTKYGFYTQPSKEKLRNFSERELASCLDFTIYHDTHGHIQWEGKSDIRALNLDKIVYLEHGHIEVYPDRIKDKPKMGSFLNKYAVIKLKNIWSPESESENKEEDRELNEKYGEMLQDHCKTKDCKFIEYDAITGDWEFSVDHFTIYGLPGGKKKGKENKKPTMLKKKKNVNFGFANGKQNTNSKQMVTPQFNFSQPTVSSAPQSAFPN